jgi:radical SAM superfamily enzyme YgiQ (UPF0313 family)
MRVVQKIFKWITLIFFGITIYAMTIGQIVPLEFANWEHMHFFYDSIIGALPIMVLLTLLWTIRLDKKKVRNIIIGILTPIISVGVFYLSIFLIFLFGFGAWVNEEITYEHKENCEITINKQIYDVGAFGYGGTRTVKLTPFLGLWSFVEEVDLFAIQEDQWNLVEKEGDIKYP